jgi:hypothetical protein
MMGSSFPLCIRTGFTPPLLWLLLVVLLFVDSLMQASPSCNCRWALVRCLLHTGQCFLLLPFPPPPSLPLCRSRMARHIAANSAISIFVSVALLGEGHSPWRASCAETKESSRSPPLPSASSDCSFSPSSSSLLLTGDRDEFLGICAERHRAGQI